MAERIRVPAKRAGSRSPGGRGGGDDDVLISRAAAALLTDPRLGSPTSPQRARLIEGLQQQHGNAYVARLVQRAAALADAPPPQKLDPHEDTKFIAVEKKIGHTAQQEKKHPSARSKAAEAQAAAHGPPDDVVSQADAAQVDKMAQAKPGDFDKKAFIAAVTKAVDAAAPKNLSEAVDFKDSGKAAQVKNQVSSLVGKDKQQSESGIKQANTEAPDASKAKPKQVTPMADEKPGAAPSDAGASQAIPSPKPASETSMDAGPAQVDDQMAKADVTEAQLKESNEPEFDAALSAKKVAEEHSQKAPEDYHATEKEVLAKAGSDAKGAAGAGLHGMHGSRTNVLLGVTGQKSAAKARDEAKRAEVAAKIESIFNQTRTEVTAILSALDGKVDAAFDAGEKSAREKFESYVDQQMSAYKKKRYKGLRGKARWVKDKFKGMPDEVNAFYRDGRDRYLKDMEKVISDVAGLVGGELGRAKARIGQGREQVRSFVDSQPKALQQVAREAEQQIGGKFNELDGEVNSKQDALVQSLADKYVAARDALDQRIDELKAENKGLIDKVVDAVAGVIQTIMHLKDMLLNVLSKAASFIGDIIKHPIRFLGNLVGAIKQGLNSFVANIGAHLQQALMGWLFGTIGETGIQLPESFDLKGILSLVLQVLGLTYANIRSIAVRMVGEKVIGAIEGTFKFFTKLASEGPGALWEWIQEKIADLNLEELVIGAIKDFVITKIITAGVTWLISMLNPAAAFIKACKMIYDVIMFFIERGSQIMEFVNSVLDSIGDIVSGNLGAAAALVENSLAKILPLAISFLASLLGVGGIAEKIKDIIEKIRAPITKLITAVIGPIVRPLKKLYDKGAKFVTGVVDKGKQLGQKALNWGKQKAKAAASWVKGRASKLRGATGIGGEAGNAKRTPQERLDEAVAAISPQVKQLLTQGVTGLRLRAQLAGWRLKYRLTSLKLDRSNPQSAAVIAKVNPEATVATAFMPGGEDLRKMVYDVADAVMADPEIQKVALNLTENPLRPKRGKAEGEHLAPQEGIGMLGTAEYFRRTQGKVPTDAGDARRREQGYLYGDVLTWESQQIGSANSQVKGIGTYPEIAGDVHFSLDGIEELEGKSHNRELARAFQSFLRGGGTPEWVKQDDDASKLFGRMTTLFQRETIRNPATAAFLPMTLDRIARGETTWTEAFASKAAAGNKFSGGDFPMSVAAPAKGQAGAQAASAELREERRRELGGMPADLSARSETARELAEREAELARKWVLSEMTAEGLKAFDDEKHARTFIETQLRKKIRGAYGLG